MWGSPGGSAKEIELAPDRAPSPPAPLPRGAGERGEFDPASDSQSGAAADGPPLPASP
jgi:hypothetical protein